MSLRIGIDGYNIAMPRGTGVATYGVALSETITAMGHESIGIFGLDVGRRPDTRELLFFDQFGRSSPVTTRSHRHARTLQRFWPFLAARAVDVPLSNQIEKAYFADRLPLFDRIVSAPGLFDIAHRHLRRYGRFMTLKVDRPPDIMHWTYPLPLRLAGARNIYTLHDLVPLRLPYTTLDSKVSYRRIVEGCIDQGDHICTVSDASLSDIVSRFPQAAGKITNSYQTAPIPARVLAANPADDAALIEGIFDLRHRGYFLFFGALDPKKNIGRIVEAYLSSQSDTPLVIVGGRSWGTEQETAMFGGGKVSVYGKTVEQDIVQLDYLPRELLLRLVRGAKAVLFPSLFEGFGLPALEAIRLGTPVITSNVSSLPEVVGDAALLVDPYDVRAITDAIVAIDGDPALAQKLVAAGPAQAAKFSEQAYAARLAAMYAHVMGRPA